MKFRASWTGTDLTSIVDAESAEEAYGMCGEFWFEQGGHGDMGFPSDVENISSAAATLGRMGGKSRSEAKRRASAENGKRGGRPRKSV